MDKRNRLALGFLLAGLSAAGRALLSVPEGVSLAELSLTVLAVVGYLVLGRLGLKALLLQLHFDHLSAKFSRYSPAARAA